MLKYTSRIGDLARTVSITYNKQRAARINQQTAGRMANQMLVFLRENQPPRYLAPPDEGVRSRPPHTSISEGWDNPATRTTRYGGASALIINRSEHINVIRYGHPMYTVPQSGTAFQRFYFRPEWAYKRSIAQYLNRMVRKGLTPMMTFYVTHHDAEGPWGGEDFVVRAARQGKEPLRRLFHSSSDGLAFDEIRRFFGRS